MAASRVSLSPAGHLSTGRRFLFMLGVVLAGAGFLVTLVLGSFLIMRAQQVTGGVPVVVAAHDVQAREALDAASVEIVTYPSNLAPTNALTALDAAVGKYALTDITERQVLTSAMVSSQPVTEQAVGQSYLPIPDGSVALTIPTSEQEGVAGYISPGDYIDVIATLSTSVFGQQPAKTVTKTIFNNLHVIRVGPETAATQGSVGGVSSSLTVVVSSCDGEMLSWLLNNANMRYELRSYKNYPSPSPTAAASPVTTSSAGAGAANAAGANAGGTGASGSPQGATHATASACPVGGTAGIGPAQVDARFGFTKI
jgi:Flp pilus assembly protein CpaB